VPCGNSWSRHCRSTANREEQPWQILMPLSIFQSHLATHHLIHFLSQRSLLISSPHDHVLHASCPGSSAALREREWYRGKPHFCSSALCHKSAVQPSSLNSSSLMHWSCCYFSGPQVIPMPSMFISTWAPAQVQGCWLGGWVLRADISSPDRPLNIHLCDILQHFSREKLTGHKPSAKHGTPVANFPSTCRQETHGIHGLYAAKPRTFKRTLAHWKGLHISVLSTKMDSSARCMPLIARYGDDFNPIMQQFQCIQWVLCGQPSPLGMV
jgi:hypothetical protein